MEELDFRSSRNFFSPFSPPRLPWGRSQKSTRRISARNPRLCRLHFTRQHRATARKGLVRPSMFGDRFLRGHMHSFLDVIDRLSQHPRCCTPLSRSCSGLCIWGLGSEHHVSLGCPIATWLGQGAPSKQRIAVSYRRSHRPRPRTPTHSHERTIDRLPR